MIGKMYRPVKMKKTKRGFTFFHKYMSNLKAKTNGEVQEFLQTVYLKAQEKENRFEEIIRIELAELSIPVLLDSKQFKKIASKQAMNFSEPFIASIQEKKTAFGSSGNLTRKMERPGIAITMESETENIFNAFKQAEFLEEKNEWVLKTDMSSKGDELIFEMPIYPTQNDEGMDWLKVEMKPVILQGKEYMEIKTHSKTQVEILSNTDIAYRT